MDVQLYGKRREGRKPLLTEKCGDHPSFSVRTCERTCEEVCETSRELCPIPGAGEN